MLRALRAGFLALTLLVSCTEPKPVPATRTPAARALVASSAPAAPEPLPAPPSEPLLVIADPVALSWLEGHGFALGDLLSGKRAGPISNQALLDQQAYASVVSVLRRDLNDVARSDRGAGVGVQRYAHRLFDQRWLSSPTARFELVGVVNRLDRAPFYPAGCGETRLVYRLSYRTEARGTVQSSRLPMTLALEIKNQESCRAAVRRFQAPSEAEGRELGAFLASPEGPLSALGLAESPERQRLVVNLQQVRWPSTVRPDLGGHAEYLLRAFRRAEPGGTFQPEPLENTPDVERLKASPELARDLLSFIRDPESLRGIDAGTVTLPERFLARRSVSVTPRGLSRGKNRPFSSLFQPRDLEGLDYQELSRVRSPAGLLRRLDTLSCAGCHEARSVAGFHFLGEDAADAPDANALLRGLSPHLQADLPRREAVSRALISGHTVDWSQAFPEHPVSGGFGEHCGLGEDPSFRDWTCQAPLRCGSLDSPAGDPVGLCLPEAPSVAGDPCEIGPLSALGDPRRDRVLRVTRAECGDRAVCNRNAVGFPGGMCTESCDALSAGAICSAIAVLDPFNACLARGEPFLECASKHVRPAGLRACGSAAPCRDDFVCARSGERGACIPPYFLFQLRVDGHP